LNCITGEQRVTSGNIIIDPTGGLGYAPQSNVIWLVSKISCCEAKLTICRPELTVQEHIRIFSDLKCLSAANHEAVNDLAKGVDLLKKLSARAETLSGGQKRKLQMAMMFAGGSAVCCVDEVSTGLDPISRRRIWEILLTERQQRTIIITTHFLDEADYLADDIAIMYKGTLRAAGTSASLKHRFGDGYTVKLPYKIDVDISISGQLQTEQSRHMTTYRVTTAAHAAEVVAELENHKLDGYLLSGPTMEELFIKITGDSIQPWEEKTNEDDTVKPKTAHIIVDATELDYELSEGQPVSLLKQWWILLLKRVKVLKRRLLPYFVAVTFALVGAGIAPLLIKKFDAPLGCPVQADLIDDNAYRNDIGVFYTESNAYYYGTDELRKSYVAGPSGRLNSTRIGLMVDVYSTNYTFSYSNTYRSGYTNSSQLENQLLIVDTYEEFAQAVQNNWKELVAHPRYSSDGGFPITEIRGGIWMGDSSTNPTIMGDISGGAAMQEMLNFYNVMAGGVGISSSYNEFASTVIPTLIASEPLGFIIYYGLIMTWYVLTSRASDTTKLT
jgi:ATP-binding cassette subfamily A (ABC1) protein 3